LTPDIDKKIKSIHSRYPWISESTLSAILSDSGEGVKILMNLAKEVDETEEKFEDATDITKKTSTQVNYLKSSVENFKEYLKDYSGDSEKVIETASKNIQDFGGAILKGSNKLAEFAPAESMYTKSFKSVLGGTEAALGGFIGAITLFGKMAMEQEKSLRVMIDYGIVSGDTSLYTTMRKNFASIGMTINNGMENFKESIPLFANTRGTVIENMNTFALMTNMLKSDESLSDMGESYEGVMRSLLDHANRLHGVGRYIGLDQLTQRRLIERFQNSTSVSSALAETLGYSRKEQEERKKEAIEDIDFRRAIISRSSFIMEQYGEEAYDNITASTEEIYSIAHRVFGPEFAKEIQDLISRGVNDIHRGGDISNNLTEDMNMMLNLLGPHVKSSFVHMLTKSTRGDFNRVEAADAFRLFIKEVDATPDLKIQGLTNPLVAKVKLLKDMAEIVPENFMNISSHEFYTLSETSAVFSEQSDDAIDAVDMMKSTFAEISSAFLPGFQTMGDALYMFEKLYSGVGGLVADVVDEITGDADDGPPPLSQQVPSRPSRFGDMNGYLPTSQNHPMRKWDKAYGSTHNPDGTLKDGNTSSFSTETGSGRNPTASSLKIKDLPPLGDNIQGGGAIQMKNQGKIRGLGLAPEVMEILQVASYEIGANVEVHSGGQMSIAEAKSLGATIKGKKYFVGGKAVRTGSTRHDSGMAADIDLVDASDGHKLDMTNDMDMARIYQFTKLSKGLGFTGIGAGDMHADGVDAYMGKHRLHVGFGVETAWGEGSSYKNAPKWLKDLYDPRSGEFIETGSIDVTDSSLKANQLETTPTTENVNITEDEVGETNEQSSNVPQQTIPTGRVSSSRPNNSERGNIPVGYETNALDSMAEDNQYSLPQEMEPNLEEPDIEEIKVSPEDRIKVRTSMSSSRPRNTSSMDKIPQAYETNALDAFASDLHISNIDASNDRSSGILDEINNIIYDDNGNYIGDSLSDEQIGKVSSLVDQLEREEKIQKSLTSENFDLPMAYINSELVSSNEVLSILDDILSGLNVDDAKERAVE
jgi:hypothetical protein